MEIKVATTKEVPQAIEAIVKDERSEEIIASFKKSLQDLINHMTDAQTLIHTCQDEAQKDFAGFYAQIFQENCTVQRRDYDRIKRALGAIIQGADEMLASATAEQNRRDKGKQFQKDSPEHFFVAGMDKSFPTRLWWSLSILLPY